ncbi:MAG: hypothetical protein K6G85_03155 [Eubacterium sp.]|nr:hypothetical protein [Eubacterium sp.]
MKGLIYSPKKGIPLFRLLYDRTGNRMVEYRNMRNGQTELLPIETMIVYLIDWETKSENQMLYSPQNRIPLGIVGRDVQGSYYIEVKYKKVKECIRFSTYIGLFFEEGIKNVG